MYRLFKDQSGATMFLFVGALSLLVVVVGMAIDMSRYLIIKSKLRTALDAALLAGAAKPEVDQQNVDIEQVVNEFFMANFPEEYLGAIVIHGTGDNAIRVIVNNTNGLTVGAEANIELQTQFARLFGVETLKVNHAARVIRDVNVNVEVAMMMDVSPSMCVRNLNAEGGSDLIFEIDESCAKFMAMKDAMRLFVEDMFDNIAVQNLSIGIVPFNHKVRFPDVNNIPPTILASEVPAWNNIPIWGEQTGAEYYSNFDDAGTEDAPLPGIVSLTSDEQTLLNAIDAINISPYGRGWTRVNLGAHTSWLMVDPDNKQYFTHDRPELPREYNPLGVDKAVILMTDGTNVSCCWSNINGDYDRAYMYRYDPDDKYLWDPGQEVYAHGGICNLMKEQGIVVFSVVYGLADIQVGADSIRNIFRNCATNEQYYFEVDSEDDIELTYKTIASSFYQLRLVQ